MVIIIFYTVFQIQTLVKDIKLAFKDYLLNKIWIDENTRKHAEEKVNVHSGLMYIFYFCTNNYNHVYVSPFVMSFFATTIFEV